MPNITSMFEAVEFIEGHLMDAIAVSDIADAISFSLYHFCRTFNSVVHHTPYDYLMRRRLSESARELIETDRKIIDIAFDYQFNTPETYSRAFKRMFEIQPNQWRKRGRMNSRLLMSRLTLAHLQHRNQGNFRRPTMKEKDAFQAAGVMTRIEEGQEIPAQLWEVLARELKGLAKRVKPVAYYGIFSYPEGWEVHGFFYMAAVEIEQPGALGSTLVVKTFPRLKFARFTHTGPHQDRQLTQDYIYQTWLPKSGQRLFGSVEIEYYGETFTGLDHQESERVIYIPIH